MSDNIYPDINEILDGIMGIPSDKKPEESADLPATNNDSAEDLSLNDDLASSDAPSDEANTTHSNPVTGDCPDSIAQIRDLISRLPARADLGSTCRTSVYFEVLSILRSFPFGTRSLTKIVNAILIDFIQKNRDKIKRSNLSI